ncbi:albusnodin family lasso peptide [Actinokineospora enzanensis]|nr:albusnodin family lasso peptide [Actinokineospora enzanensis]
MATPMEPIGPLLDLGDAAELTLGVGRSTNEDKRYIYN